jgi:hypothetical protein
MLCQMSLKINWSKLTKKDKLGFVKKELGII